MRAVHSPQQGGSDAGKNRSFPETRGSKSLRARPRRRVRRLARPRPSIRSRIRRESAWSAIADGQTARLNLANVSAPDDVLIPPPCRAQLAVPGRRRQRPGAAARRPSPPVTPRSSISGRVSCRPISATSSVPPRAEIRAAVDFADGVYPASLPRLARNLRQRDGPHPDRAVSASLPRRAVPRAAVEQARSQSQPPIGDDQ